MAPPRLAKRVCKVCGQTYVGHPRSEYCRAPCRPKKKRRKRRSDAVQRRPAAGAPDLESLYAKMEALHRRTERLLSDLESRQEEWRAARLTPASPATAPSGTTSPLEWVQALAPLAAGLLQPRGPDLTALMGEYLASAGRARSWDRAADLIEEALPFVLARFSGLSAKDALQLIGHEPEPGPDAQADEGGAE